jgi:hypothetical protein
MCQFVSPLESLWLIFGGFLPSSLLMICACLDTTRVRINPMSPAAKHLLLVAGLHQNQLKLTLKNIWLRTSEELF